MIELQETSVEKIAIYSLENLPDDKNNIFVEDTGLFIEGLKEFPGPYASHAFKTLGNLGILKLMDGIEKRNAYFESCVAYKDSKGTIHSFVARCDGIISKDIKGEFWGFDPIFIPISTELNQNNKTFSELGDDVKNKLSHRTKALNKLKEYLKSSKSF